MGEVADKEEPEDQGEKWYGAEEGEKEDCRGECEKKGVGKEKTGGERERD